jgi:hypothetical protein
MTTSMTTYGHNLPASAGGTPDIRYSRKPGRGERQIARQVRERHTALAGNAALLATATDVIYSEYQRQRDYITAGAYDVSDTVAAYPDDFMKPVLQGMLVGQLRRTAGHFDTLLSEYAHVAQRVIGTPYTVDNRNAWERLIGAPK